MGDEPALFEVDPAWRVSATPGGDGDHLSAGRRLTLRQAEQLAAGWHPISHGRLHVEAAPAGDRKAEGRRCGNCWFRVSRAWGDVAGRYPKCWFGWDGRSAPRATRGPATDCRGWFPGCTDHRYEHEVPESQRDAPR